MLVISMTENDDVHLGKAWNDIPLIFSIVRYLGKNVLSLTCHDFLFKKELVNKLLDKNWERDMNIDRYEEWDR